MFMILNAVLTYDFHKLVVFQTKLRIIQYFYIIQAMSSADMIVVMDKGHVKWVGSSTDFSVSSYSTFCSLNEFTVSQVQSLECSTNTSTETKQDCKPERDSICVPGEAQEIIEVELRKEGRVELTVYKWVITFTVTFGG